MREKLLDKDYLQYVQDNYNNVLSQIDRACRESGRDPSEITLLAATKSVPPEIVNYAISLGVSVIGENRVQELNSKYEHYDLQNCRLHFIGQLQTNKVKYLIGKVSLIHSVDSIKLADEINRQSFKKGVITAILIEINIAKERSKAGIDPSELDYLLEHCRKLENVRVRGLMSIPPICDTKAEVMEYFNRMNNLFLDKKSKTMDNVTMDYLSIGMSSDYPEAIRAGGNLIRIGTGLFGKRESVNNK